MVDVVLVSKTISLLQLLTQTPYPSIPYSVATLSLYRDGTNSRAEVCVVLCTEKRVGRGFTSTMAKLLTNNHACFGLIMHVELSLSGLEFESPRKLCWNVEV
jgi:hypothetical protein